MELRVVSCPSNELAFTNCVFLNPRDASTLGIEGDIHLDLRGFVYAAKAHENVESGGVGMNSIQRRLIEASLGDNVPAAVFAEAEATLLSTAAMEIDFVVKKKSAATETIDGAALAAALATRHAHQYLTSGQSIAVEYQGTNLLIKVGPLEALVISKSGGGGLPDGGKVSRGMLVSQTQLLLSKAQGSPIVLTGMENQARKTIFKQDFSFAEMGIGGLDKEFSDIFRYIGALAPSRPRALAPSRPRALAPSRPRALAPSRPRALAPPPLCGHARLTSLGRPAARGAGGPSRRASSPRRSSRSSACRTSRACYSTARPAPARR